MKPPASWDKDRLAREIREAEERKERLAEERAEHIRRNG